jgi:hypothetical protein
MLTDFDKQRADLDRQFKVTQKLVAYGALIWCAVVLGLIGFGVWVVVKLLAYFHVI